MSIIANAPAPVVTIYGGKITTYRQSSLEAINQLSTLFPHLEKSHPSTNHYQDQCLGNWTYKEYLHHAREKYFWLEESLKNDICQLWLPAQKLLLANCTKMADLGSDFGNGLYQVEIDYLQGEEWATTCDDILWRRTKLGLNFPAENLKHLAEYLKKIYSPRLDEVVIRGSINLGWILACTGFSLVLYRHV